MTNFGKVKVKETMRETVRYEQNGSFWMGRIVHTQIIFLDTIPVAMFLVHTFEELKAKEYG